jgi:hypothetical protein
VQHRFIQGAVSAFARQSVQLATDSSSKVVAVQDLKPRRKRAPDNVQLRGQVLGSEDPRRIPVGVYLLERFGPSTRQQLDELEPRILLGDRHLDRQQPVRARHLKRQGAVLE